MTKARRCTLLAGIRIERGTRADWEALASLHYRSHAAGAVSDIFRMVHKQTRDKGTQGQRGEEPKNACVPPSLCPFVPG